MENDYLARFLACIKWLQESMQQNPARTIGWVERLRRDPNMQRLRPLFEEPVAVLPQIDKPGRPYTWGVAKDATPWLYTNDRRTFMFGAEMWDTGIDRLDVRMWPFHVLIEQFDIVAAHNGRPRPPLRTLIRYYHGEGWRPAPLNADTIVRTNSLVMRTPEGVVEEDVRSLVRTTLVAHPRDGLLGGETWCVVWHTDGPEDVAFDLISAMDHGRIRMPTSKFDASVPPRAFSYVDDEGVTRVTVVLRAAPETKTVMRHGPTFAVVTYDGEGTVEDAFLRGGFVWMLRSAVGQTWLTVNNRVVKEVGVRVRDVRAVGDYVVVLLCMMTGQKRETHVKVLKANGAPVTRSGAEMWVTDTSLDLWPYVRYQGEYKEFALTAAGVLNVTNLPVSGVLQEGRGDADGCVYFVGKNCYDGTSVVLARGPDNARWQTFVGKGTFVLSTATVASLGRLFAAAKDVHGEVTVHGLGGEVTVRGYDDVRDIVVRDTRITFLAREGRQVLRVTLPLLATEG